MHARTLAAVLLAAWLGLVLNGGAHAADWRSLSTDEGTQAYIDQGSILVDGSTAEALVLVNYSTARTLGDDWFPHRSQVVRYRVACTTGETALKAWAFRAGELGSGATVWKGAQPSPQLGLPAHDSVESRLVARVCSAPQASLVR